MKKHEIKMLSVDEFLTTDTATKTGYFKLQEPNKIPATQIFVEETGSLPNTIIFNDSFDCGKILLDKKLNLTLVKESYFFNKRKTDSEEIFPTSILLKHSKGLYLFLNDGRTIMGDEDDGKQKVFSKNSVTISSSYIRGTLMFSEDKRDDAIKLCKELRKYFIQYEEDTNKMYIVCEGSGGLYLENFEIGDYEMDIELNYGKEFVPIHNLMIERLNKTKDKGIVLLHGLPGTGKSHYLRHIVTKINKKKDVIYIPPDLTHQIASPHFIPFLMDNKNSVLFIEDAENVLRKREGGNNQAISNLLNLSDGLLSDCLSIQLVCTFNCDIGEVDQALLRKGRLIAKHKFDKLSIENCNKLSKKLGFKNEIKEEMTLTEIFNQDDMTFNETKKRVGFGA